ncbi:MAG: DUF4249 family protein [Paludibacteraceae bacterium]
MQKSTLLSRLTFFPATLWVLVVVFVFSSCVTDINYAEQSTSIPVLNCVLTNDTVQRLSLTRSVRMNDSYFFKEIKDAKIILYQDDVEIGTFMRVGYDNWQLAHTPQSGKTYRIKATLSEGQVLSAETVMPKRLQLQLNQSVDKSFSKNFIQKSFGSPCWITIITSDSIIKPASRPTAKDRGEENIGTDHPLADYFNQQGNMSETISQANTPRFEYYIRLKADSISGAVPFKLQARFVDHVYVCFRTASAEYDRYLKTSMQKIIMRLDTSDPGIWFDETVVYSNVNNGTGIFAAYNDLYFRYNGDFGF